MKLIGEVMRIKICEFRSKNIPENDLTYVEVEEENGVFFYINYYGDRSFRYNSLDEAKRDMINLFGKYKDFRLL